jgi:small subunit ribosomal protein S12
MHRTGPHYKNRPLRKPLDGKPFAKGVVLKILIKKPKKPNSATRKCVLVRLSTGKEIVAYVPRIGHNLQEHNIVLCRFGRCQDVPGVKVRCVGGKYDLPHVVKKRLLLVAVEQVVIMMVRVGKVVRCLCFVAQPLYLTFTAVSR